VVVPLIELTLELLADQDAGERLGCCSCQLLDNRYARGSFLLELDRDLSFFDVLDAALACVDRDLRRAAA
jgi:hypothetical protein